MFLTLEKGLKELTILTLSFSINSFSSCALFLSSDWLYFLLKCAFHTSAVYNTSITPLSAFNFRNSVHLYRRPTNFLQLSLEITFFSSCLATLLLIY